ncbi:hypothetical protein BH23CHL6_BH23CHL6_05840 [soil metagenome]
MRCDSDGRPSDPGYADAAAAAAERAAHRRRSVCRSVQLSLPVCGHSTGRPGDWLIDRVVMRRSKYRTIEVLLGPVVPEPILARFIALHDWIPGAVRMVAGVLRRRRIATPDVPAMGTPPEVEPPSAGLQALDAARAAGWYPWIDVVLAWHSSPLCSFIEPSGNRSPAGQPTADQPWRHPLLAARRRTVRLGTMPSARSNRPAATPATKPPTWARYATPDVCSVMAIWPAPLTN